MSTPTEFNGLCRISQDGKYLTEINCRAVTGSIMPGIRDIWRVTMDIQKLPDPRFTFTLLPVEPMPILIDDLLTLSPVVGPPLLPIPMLVEPGKPGPDERQLWKLDTVTVVKRWVTGRVLCATETNVRRLVSRWSLRRLLYLLSVRDYRRPPASSLWRCRVRLAMLMQC